MAESGKDVVAVGDVQPGVSSFLQGGDSGSYVVSVGDLGAVRRNDVGYGGIPHGIFKEDLWETGKAIVQQDLGDIDGRGVPTGGGEEFRG